MTTLLIVACAVVLVWALWARPLSRYRITMPLVMTAAGIVTSLVVDDRVGFTVLLNSSAALQVAELILALLLFVDATEVHPRTSWRSRGPVLRLLFIALPLSLVAAVMCGVWLLQDLSIAVILALACIVVPVDFSPLTSMVKDASIPARLRQILNLESGYNDGVVAPLFLVALALAGDTTHGGATHALGQAVPAALIALVVGAAVGAGFAALATVCADRRWYTDQSMRLAMVAVALLTYGAAVAAHGNGFVAAFVAGSVYRLVRRDRGGAGELTLVEDISVINNMVLWFVLGATAIFVTELVVDPWPVVLYVVLALTVVRAVPVVLSLLGSGLPRRERVLLGVLGPRGTASVVFGLLAFNVIPEDEFAYSVLAVTILTLGASLLLHGVGAPWLIRATLGRPTTARTDSVAAAVKPSASSSSSSESG